MKVVAVRLGMLDSANAWNTGELPVIDRMFLFVKLRILCSVLQLTLEAAASC